METVIVLLGFPCSCHLNSFHLCNVSSFFFAFLFLKYSIETVILRGKEEIEGEREIPAALLHYS